MKQSFQQLGTAERVSQLIAKARDAEISRDLDRLEELLSEVWDDFDKNPDYSEFEPDIRAELLRISGYYLATFGSSNTRKNYQDRGKDLISKSIALFEELRMPHELARAKALLASVYYYSGQVEECEIILDEAAVFYDHDQLHPVNLLIAVTKVGALIWKNDYQAAVEILNNVQIPMELCEDHFLLVRYHMQAGIIYSRIERFELSKTHFEKGIYHSEALGNLRYLGSIYNSFSLGYLRNGDLEQAREKVAESIKIFKDVNERGWLANAFDTEAQIYLADEKFEKALESIDKSIELFKEGEFFSGWTDALWVKVHVLLRSDKKEEAIMLYGELADLAGREIGEYAVRKYANKFSKIIHVKKGTDFFGEVQAFKRELLMESLVDSDADIDQSAESLKTNRKEIIHLLNREFPDIYLELGMSPHVMSTANN